MTERLGDAYTCDGDEGSLLGSKKVNDLLVASTRRRKSTHLASKDVRQDTNCGSVFKACDQFGFIQAGALVKEGAVLQDCRYTLR
jgi:hypothetical protein